MLPFHHMVVQTIFHIAAVHLVTAKNTNQLNLIQLNGKLVKKKLGFSCFKIPRNSETMGKHTLKNYFLS